MAETTETTPAPAPAEPAAKKVKMQAPKKAAGDAKSKKASGPSVSELIVKAVNTSKERSGMSLAAVKKALGASGYDVDKNNSRIKVALNKKQLETKEKAAAKKKAPAKPKKPAAKKAPAKSPKKPKKVPAAAKSPKKVKKPAKAAAAKSPKKTKAAKPKKAVKSPARKSVKPKAAKSPAKAKAAKPKATKAKKVAPKKK
ncbi:hypothetical protein GDO86_016557 [Hymenochirus boettgeri]|uniref:H15 domain-containing protein n=1 Tax=Hymenochirus boettgeri TaxID=247094 RepID=A0A8T2K2E0_9PIPI|nr:hypothetical protein GDO86_016557 [Hymenochirus boettgeri]